MAVHLTKQEELEVLESAHGSFNDNGSSRAVYEITWQGKSAVLKVYLDTQGLLQTNIELNLLAEMEAEDEEHCCATAYAIGETCVIYENVILCDLPDTFEGDPEEIAERNEMNVTDVRDMCAVFEYLNHHTGYTADNGQIGYSQIRGKYVAYDFGYDTLGYNSDELCGHMYDYIGKYGEDGVLDIAMNILNGKRLWLDEEEEEEEEDICGYDEENDMGNE